MGDQGAGSLLRFAEEAVNQVISQFKQQQGVVQDQALNPINTIAQAVQDKVPWYGGGADKFAEFVATLLIPDVGNLIDQVVGYQDNLLKASDILKQADGAAEKLVGGLEDQFSSIFP